MPSYTRQFAINGIIDTSKPVMQNMNTLASAAGSWVTFDVNAGLWSVVINQPGTSVKSFTDSNIIGALTISNTGLTELYNSVQLEFPHKDLLDRVDTITFSIPEVNRYANEQDNVLNFEFDCVNDPVQAELLAARELKQSRVDKVIQFSTDFTSLGLKAGDLIDVTSTIYGFNEKLFRILSISEDDGQNGEIVLTITAFEYNADVFSTAGLEREIRTTQNDISSECANTALQNSNAAEGAAKTANGLALIAPLLLTKLLNSLGRRSDPSSPGGFTPGALSQVYSFEETGGLVLPASNSGYTSFNLGTEIDLPYTGRYKLSMNLNWALDPASSSPPLGYQKLSKIIARVNGSDQELNFTGDYWSPAFEDQFIEGFFEASEGDTFRPVVELWTNYPDYYSVPSGYPAHTPPSGATVGVYPTVTLEFVGEI